MSPNDKFGQIFALEAHFIIIWTSIDKMLIIVAQSQGELAQAVPVQDNDRVPPNGELADHYLQIFAKTKTNTMQKTKKMTRTETQQKNKINLYCNQRTRIYSEQGCKAHLTDWCCWLYSTNTNTNQLNNAFLLSRHRQTVEQWLAIGW